MPKPNKDGWIRHRGGVPKCLDDIGLIRTREGDVEPIEVWFKPAKLDSKVFWAHYGKYSGLSETDIMAYKLKEQTKQ